MSTTFGNSLERPCVDCGGHPLRAVHDRNGAGFTHYYVGPVEHKQPAPEGEEWRANGCFIDRIDRNGRYQVVAQAGSEEYAATILRNHRLAALVPGLQAALEAAYPFLDCNCMGQHESDCAKGKAERALNAVAKEWEK